MKDIEVKYEGNHIVAYNKLLFETFPTVLFDPSYLVSNSLLVANENSIQHGRGNIHCFEYKNLTLVLRHYHRGGIPAKLVNDKYLWVGLDNTRAIQELKILSSMQEWELPVPTPVAAHVNRDGMSYRADIITVFIPNSKTLSSILREKALSEETWQQLGRIIKSFHVKNCNHADLNAHNILLNEQDEIFLIDFDKSKIDDGANEWRSRNLERLKRSLEKLSNSNENFNYTAANFSILMQGYSDSY